MKPVRCLAISNSYPPDHAGGYELGACNILESLAKHCGWQNTVLSAVRRSKSSKTDSPELTGFFPGKLGPEVELWRTRRTLLRHHSDNVEQMRIKASKADVVFVFNPRCLVYPQWTSVIDFGIPAFVFVSDHWPHSPLASDLFHAKSKKNGDGNLRDEKLHQHYASAPQETELLGLFRGVLFGSRFLQKEQAQLFSANPNQAVTHWGIDPERFPKISFSSERLRTFGFCGRPEKEKGLELALATVRELASRDHAVCLLVACDLQSSSYGRAITKKIKADSVLRKHVRLLGQVPHANLNAIFYSQIGVLLFPSIWQEPFALTVLEAMASGALVIASSTGGTPEVIDETTGYLFDPELEGDLTRVCRSALVADVEDNRRRVESGYSRIRELHTLEFMAGRVDEFVRGLL